MKLGVLTALFQDKSLDEALDIITDLGVGVVEVGTGGYPGDAHCKPDVLLKKDEKALKRFKSSIEEKNFIISALSCHGNPLHPNPEISGPCHEAFQKTVLLAEKLGLENVNTFSGCPGGSDADRTPNWVTCPWPGYTSILKWQWEKKIIPYWTEQAQFARDHGVKIGFEMHPGFSVYNPESLLRLRKVAGDNIGANFDPSHLFWQGIDPIAAVYELKDCIYHVHAKDTKVNEHNSRINGVLDTKPYSEIAERSWIFRTVGYGHSYDFWKDFLSVLCLIGYDYVLSIEHEDSLMSSQEGLEKAVSFLKEVMLKEKPEQM